MSKNAFTDDQSHQIYHTLKTRFERDEVENALVELAERFSKTTTSIKLHVQRKYPEQYNEWFKASVKTDRNRLKVNELVELILEITDYPKDKREFIKSTMEGKTFPQQFAEEIYLQLLANKLALNQDQIALSREGIKMWGIRAYFFCGLGALTMGLVVAMILTTEQPILFTAPAIFGLTELDEAWHIIQVTIFMLTPFIFLCGAWFCSKTAKKYKITERKGIKDLIGLSICQL